MKKKHGEVRTFRLPGTWMRDHLECCVGVEYWGLREAPEGNFTPSGKIWVGQLDQHQINEIFSRCDVYTSMYPGLDYEDNKSICDAAFRTIDALKRQGASWIRREQ